MTEWPFFSILEWQIMTALTLLSTLLSWWKRRRWMQVFSLACLSVLILAISFREPIRPGLLLPGIFLGFFHPVVYGQKDPGAIGKALTRPSSGGFLLLQGI